MFNGKTRVLAAILVLSISGCSFFIKGVPGDHKADEDPGCQDYIIAPIADGVVGGLAGLYGVSSCGRTGTACLAPISVGAVFLGAAVWGTLKVRKCRKAKREYKQASGEEAGAL